LKKEYIEVAGIPVEVWWKSVKNINIAVSGPDGRVRISVPRSTSAGFVRQAVLNRLAWITKQQLRFQMRPQAEVLKAISGEMHSIWGETYPLSVFEGSPRHYVTFDTNGIALYVRSGTSAKARLQRLHTWYREELKKRIPALLQKWEPRVGRVAAEWRIKRMKTRWGTCNIMSRRLWLNLELAKKPPECLEYILVHELVHLLEINHNEKFYAHMDRLLPNWQHTDSLLKMEK